MNIKTLILSSLVISYAIASNFAVAQPWLSSPSAVLQGDTIQLNGGGLTAGQQISLKIAHPSFDDILTLTADQSGNITQALLLDGVGVYTAELWELGAIDQGLPLAKTVTITAPAN